MMKLRRAWVIYAKALGVKPDGLTDREADLAAIVRTVILAIPSFCIIANTGRTFGLW
jgi:hypothetical protein